jgi:ferritin-like metal-binding protein YciE
MENQVSSGMNKTGAQMAPLGTPDIERFARERADGEGETNGSYEQVHQTYMQEADRIGSVPVPATMKGMATTAISAMTGKKPAVFLDKLGERLAYERTGVRLYQALILKCTAAHADTGGMNPDLGALNAIRNDEEAHFNLLSNAIKTLGGDPTAMTPCADISGVMGMGFLQVVTDPRTTVSQALNAMLAVELADNASWELLIQLAQRAGHDDMARDFTSALEAERRHLELVTQWTTNNILEEAA